MSQASKICITDKTGKKYWNTVCSTAFLAPEIRNMQRHLDAARKDPKAYHFLDLATAYIMVDGEKNVEMTDDELLAELMS